MSSDLMYRIAALQLFDGSFNLDSTFCGAININMSDAQREANRFRWDLKAYATILALAFFREKLSSLQEDWELIADKSRIWIAEKAAYQADAMFESAVKMVNN